MSRDINAKRRDITTLLEYMKGQQMTVVHTPVLNNNTDNSMSSVPNEVRNVANFLFGFTTSTTLLNLFLHPPLHN